LIELLTRPPLASPALPPGPAFRSPWALPPLFLVPTVQVVDQIFDSGVAAAALPSAGSPYASSMVRSKV